MYRINCHGENGDLLIQKAPACTIQTQAEAVCELFGGKKEDIKVIGIRHGEKMYETLLTNEECAKAVDMGNFYRVPADNRGLNYVNMAYSEHARRYLADCGLPKERTYVTGSPMAEVLHNNLAEIETSDMFYPFWN